MELVRPVTANDLFTFWLSELVDALERERTGVSPIAQVYLAALLNQQIEQGYHPAETLGDRFALALQERSVARLAKLRRVGDQALVCSGFWWRYCKHDLAYQRRLGRMSYGIVGGMPCDELAKAFDRVADALAELSTRYSLKTHAEILQLYRLWRETHSRHAARVLAERGLLVGAVESSRPS